MIQIRCTTCSERHTSAAAVYICGQIFSQDQICDCGSFLHDGVDHSRCWQLNAY